MVKVRKTGDYDQMIEDLLVENPDLGKIIEKKVTWFKKNPDDTRLDNHSLTKRMTGRWAFSITDDIRVVYKWESNTTTRFLAIGSHPTVYPKKH